MNNFVFTNDLTRIERVWIICKIMQRIGMWTNKWIFIRRSSEQLAMSSVERFERVVPINTREWVVTRHVTCTRARDTGISIAGGDACTSRKQCIFIPSCLSASPCSQNTHVNSLIKIIPSGNHTLLCIPGPSARPLRHYAVHPSMFRAWFLCFGLFFRYFLFNQIRTFQDISLYIYRCS